MSSNKFSQTTNRDGGLSRGLLAYLMVAVLLLAGLGAVSPQRASAAVNGEAAGTVDWHDADLSVAAIWTANTLGQIAGTGTGTGTTPIQYWLPANGSGKTIMAIVNLAIASNSINPGFYTTRGSGGGSKTAASAEVKARYGYEDSFGVEWAARDGIGITRIEVPLIPETPNEYIWGMEVNPKTNELVMAVGAVPFGSPTNITTFLILNPGPDADPVTVSDNTFRVVRGNGTAIPSTGLINDITVDGDGNIYVMSSGLSGNVYKYDGITGATSLYRTFSLGASTVANTGDDQMAFLNGQFVHIAGDLTSNSLGFDTATGKSGGIANTSFANKGLSTMAGAYRYDGAGSTGYLVTPSATIDLSKSTYEVSSAPVNADGTSTATVTVYLKDTAGNFFSGDAAKLTGTSSETLGSGTISAFTESNGKYTATITSTTPGDKNITVAHTTGPVPNVTNKVAHFAALDVDTSNGNTWFDVTSSATVVAANGSATHRVEVSLADKFGNPVTPNAASLATLTAAAANLGTGSVSAFTSTGTAGHYQATISSTVIGSKTVTSKYGSNNINKKVTGSDVATFGNTDVDLGNVSTRFVVSSGTKMVSESHTVTVYLADSSGNPVSGKAGLLAGLASGGGVVGLFTESGTSGMYTAPVTSVTVGDKTVSVTYSGGLVSSRGDNSVARFVAGDPVFGVGFSSYTVSDGTRVADGSAYHEITVTLLDANKNPVAGLQSTLFAGVRSAYLGTGFIGGFSETYLGSGVYVARVTSTVAGTFGFDVRSSSVLMNSVGNPFARFVAGPPELGNSTLSNYTVSTGSVLVVDDQHMITVVLRDKFNNAVVLDSSGLRSLSAVASPSAGVSIAGFTADVNTPGLYTAVVTSTQAGDKTITAYYSGTAIQLANNGNRVASFVSGGVDLKNVESWFTVTTGAVEVGLTQKISVKLVDAKGNPVSGVTGLTASASPNGGVTFPAVLTATGVAGMYEGTVSSTIPGSKTIRVYLGASDVSMRSGASSLGVGNDQAVFFAGAVSATTSSFSVSEGAVTVSDYHTVTVVLKDKYGNPLSGKKGSLVASSSTSGASYGLFSETGTAGTYTAQVRSNTANTYPVNVVAEGTVSLQSLYGVNRNAVFVSAGPVASNSSFTVTSGSRTVIDSHTVTVTLRNGMNDLVALPSGMVLSAIADKSLGAGQVGPFSSTGNLGEYSAQITSTVPDTFVITASLGGSALSPSGNRNAVFIAGPVAAAVSTFTVSDNRNVLVGAGNFQTVDVYLTDIYGNLVEDGVANAYALAATSAQSLGSGSFSVFTKVSGKGHFQGTVWSTMAGGKTVAVTYNSTSLVGTGNVVAWFKAGPVDFTSSKSNFTVSLGDRLVGGPTHDVTVALADMYGNPISDLAGSLTSATNDAIGSGSVSGFTEGSGAGVGTYHATVSSSVVGVKTMTARLSGTSLSVKPAGNDKATFTSSDVDLGNVSTRFVVSSGTKMVSESHTVTVYLADSSGNPVSGKAGLLAGLASGGGVVGLFTESGTSGMYTAPVTSVTVGDKTVSVTYSGGLVSSRGDNSVARFVAGDPVFGVGFSSYTVSDGTRVADGSAYHEITVTLLDANKNPVAGLQSTLFAGVRSAYLGTGFIGGFSETYLGSGVYVARVTSTVAGTFGFDVRSSSVLMNSVGNPFARFVAGPPELGNSTLSNYTVSTGSVLVVDDQHMITVVLRDKFNNAVVLDSSGLRSLSAVASPSAGVSIAGFTADVNTPGLYTAVVTSTQAGDKTITAYYSGTAIQLANNGNRVASFVSGGVDLKNVESWFTVTTGAVEVGLTQKISVKLVDAKGNPVSGVTGLTASASPNGGVTFPAVLTATGVAGMYEGTVSSTIPGSKTIRVYLGASDVSMRSGASSLGVGNDQAVFFAGAVSATTSSFSVSEGAVTVSDYHTVTVVLKDKYGNPLSGKKGSLVASSSTSGASYGLFSETGTAGTYTAQVRSNTANTYPVNVVAEGTVSLQSLYGVNRNAVFVSAGPVASNSSFTVTSGSRTVIDSHTVTVTLRNGMNDLVALPSGMVLSAIADKSLGAGQVGPFSSTGNLGEYSAQITSTVPDTFVITASLGGSALSPSGNRNAVFIAGPVAAAVSTFTVSDNRNVLVGAGNFQTVDVYLTDIYGNLVEDGVANAYALAATSAQSLGSGSFSVFTKVSGKGHFQGTVWSTMAGGKTVAVTYNSTSLVGTGNVVAWFKAGPVDFTSSKSNFTVSLGDRLVGGPTHDVTVALADMYGNPISDLAGSLTSATNDAIGSGSVSGFTEGSGAGVGTYHATVSSSVVGVKTMTARLSGTSLSVKPAGNDKATFTSSDVDLGNVSTRFVVSSGTKMVSESHTVTVYLADSSGNPVSGKAGLLAGLASGGGVVGLFTESGTSGMYTAPVTSVTVGDKTVSVTYSGGLVSSRGDNSVARFVAGDPVFGVGFSSYTVSDGTRVADGSAYHEITVTLLDANKNPVAGLQSTLFAGVRSAYLGTGFIGGFSETYLGSGVYVARVTSTVAGTFGFDVRSSSVLMNSVGNPFARFVAGPPELGNSTLSNYTVSTGSVLVVDDQHMITVVLRDKFNNAVVLDSSGLRSLSAVASPSAGVSIAGFTADVNTPGLYTAVVTSTQAGDKTITAYYSGTAIQLANNGNRVASFVSGGVDLKNVESWFTVTTGAVEVGLTQKISVKLVDAKGNPVSGVTGLTASASPNGGVTFPAVLTATGVAGMYEGTVSSTIPGSKTIRVYLGASDVSMRSGASSLGVGNDQAVFFAGAVSATTSSFSVSEGAVTVSDYHTVTVVLKDKYGNPLSGKKGSLVASSSTSGASYGLFSETGTAGTYTAQVRSNTANTYPVNVVAEGTVSLQSLYGVNRNAVFVSAGPVASNSSFTVTSGSRTVIDSHTVTVTLRNGMNDLVALPSGMVLSAIADKSLGAGQVGPFSSTGNLGEYSAQITSTVPDTFVITASLGGSALSPSGNRNAVFIAGPVAAAVSTFTVSDNRNVLVGAGNFQTVDVYLTDIYGNLVEDGVANAYALAATSAQSLGSGSFSVFTKVSGKGHFQGTVWSTMAGGKTVAVTYNSTSLVGTGNVVAWFKAGPVDFTSSKSNFTVSLGDRLVGGPTHDVTVALADMYGNPISDLAGSLTSATNDAIGSGSVSGFTEGSGAGVGTYHATVSSSVVGVKTMTARLSGTSLSVKPAGNDKATFTSSDVDLGNVSTRFVVSSGTKMVSESHTVTVYLADSSGNPVSGKAGLLAGLASGGGVVGLFTESGTSGMYTAPVTSVTVGDKTVSVTYSGGLVSSRGDNSVARFVAGDPVFGVGFSSYTVSDGTRVADGSAYHEITVTLLDANKNPVAGLQSTLFAGVRSAYLGTGFIGGFSETYLGSGVYVARVTSTVAGTFGFDVRSSSVLMNSVGNPFARFVAGPPELGNSTLSNYTVSTGSVLVVDDQHMITVVLRDKFNNAVVLDSSGLRSLSAVASPSAGVSIAGFTADVNTPGLYTAVVTSTQAGDKTITAYYSGTAIQLANNGNRVASFVSGGVDLKNVESWFTVTTGAVEVGLTQKISVKLVDAKGNPVSGVTGLTASASPNGGVTFPAVLTATGVAGMYEGTVSSTIPGSKTIRVYLGASDVSMRSGASSLGVGNDQAVFFAGAVSATTSSFSVSEGAVTVSDYHTVTVVLKDKYGNPLSGKKGSLVASSSTSGASYGLFSETGTAGTYTAQVRSNTANTYPVNVVAEGTVSLQSLYGVNRNAVFVSAGPVASNSSFTVTSGSRTVIDSHTVTVTLRNGMNDLVALPSGMVLSAIADKSLGAGQVGPFSSTGNLGEYSAQITSTVPDTFVITASLGGSALSPSGNRNAVFIAGPVAAAVSTFTVSDNRNVLVGAGNFQTVDVYLTDIYGNLVEDGVANAYALAATSAQSLGSGSFSVFTKVSGKGHFQGTVWSTMAGGKTVAVTYNSTSLVGTGNVVAWFKAGPVDFTSSKSNFTVSLGDRLVGGPTHDVTVALADMYGNPISDLAGSLTSATNDAIGSGSVSGFTEGSGAGVGTYHATVSSSVVGVKTMTARLSGTSLSVKPAGNDKATFTSSDVDLGNVSTRFVVSSGTKMVSESHTVTVYLADSSGNPVSGKAGLLAGLASGGGVVGLFTESGTSGMYTAPVTSVTVGDKTVSVTYSGGLVSSRGDNSVARFVAGDDVDLDASGTGYSVSTGVKQINVGKHTITVTTVNTSGVPTDVANIALLVGRGSGLGVGVVSTFTKVSTGVYTASVTSSISGKKQIDVSYQAYGLKSWGKNTIAEFTDQPSKQVPGLVLIDGTPEVGQTLTGSIKNWEVGTSCKYQWQSDGVNIPGATSTVYVIDGKYVKTNIVMVATCSNSSYTDPTVTPSKELGPVTPKVTRIGGKDRYDTSALINDRFAEQGKILFIATGQVYADALSAGPAVALVGGSLMLSSQNTLSTSIRQEITDMGPSKIYIMGQKNSVSDAVLKELGAYAPVERIGGADRYETSFMIYKKFFGDTTDVYLASGREFADALVASSAAGYLKAPVILVDGKSSTSLDAKTRNLMVQRNVSQVRIAGGPNTVNDSIMVDAKKYIPTVTRAFGADRYATAIAINKVFTAGYFDHVWIATGKVFADALSGSVPAATFGEPIYLSRPECLSPGVVSALGKIKYGERIILGGLVSLPDAIMYMTKVCA